MNSGLIFYWFCWALWIVVTFFMNKGELRTIMAYWILMLILFSNFYFSIAFYQISGSFLILFGGTLLLHVKLPRLIFRTFTSFTIMIGYTGIQIWMNFTPFRLFVPQLITVSFVLVLLITMLTNGLINRLGTGLFGIACGEMIYSMIMGNYAIHKTMGDMGFFDCVLIVTMLLVCHDLLLKMNRKVYILLSSTKQSLRQRT